MIAALLPSTVVAEEAFDDDAPVALFEDELAAIDGAPEHRCREFATARLCARRALARLGVAPAPIVPDGAGAPQWPAGIVGSLTHCRGYRAAAVARTTDVAGVGVDAEPHEPLPEGLQHSIAFGDEVPRLAVLRRRDPDLHWDRILFSAKESFFKAWFPLHRTALGFADADVDLAPGGTFTARALVPTAVGANGPVAAGLGGRWHVVDGLIHTSVVQCTHHDN